MNKLLVILFFLSVFLISFLPVKDTDFGWHYRCGKDFVQKRSFCVDNQFSYFLTDYKFYYSSFLYDVSLAFIYDRFGFIGISLLGAITMTISALVFYLILGAPLWFTATAFYILINLSGPVFALGLRSQIPTFLFLLITLSIVKRTLKRQDKIFYLFPLVFLIWANSHPGFFLGLIILLIFNLHLAWEFFNKKNQLFGKILMTNLIILALSILATFINPVGSNAYLELLRHFSVPLHKWIAEWARPNLFGISFIVLSSVLLTYLALKNKTYRVFNILLLLFFTVLALSAKRNISFYLVVFFYVLVNNLLPDSLLSIIEDKLNLNRLYLLIAAPFIFFLALTSVPQTIAFDTKWEKYCGEATIVYPCEAIKKYPRLSGNVFAIYEWGGFLIWQKPQVKVFIDGRMPAWKDEKKDSANLSYIKVIQAQTGWEEILTKNKTDYILIANGTFLDLTLHPDPKKYNWQEAYRDRVAVIYKKI